LRNALLITYIDLGDFNWHPGRPPVGFLQETARPPAILSSKARDIRDQTVGGDFDVARALASHLIDHARVDGAVQSLDPEENYRAIIEEGRGYCSDYVDAFIALALAVEIPVRAWAFSFDGFGGYGHIVVEIFDRQREKWIMLDVYNNVYPVDRETGGTLSALKVREMLIANSNSVKFLRIGPGRVAFPIEAKLFDYYRRGLSEWYLWFGNNVISRGQHPFTRVAASVFEPLGELHAIARGAYPRIVPLKSNSNSERIEWMKAIKQTLLWAAGVALALSVALVLQLVLWFARWPRVWFEAKA
jgi:hypothetical protein